MTKNKVDCNHCQGKGYIEIRDCVGDIQYTETCSFCEGLGFLKVEHKSKNISRVNSNSNHRKS